MKKLVYVEWVDHFARHGWDSAADGDVAALDIQTIGWVIQENPKILVLAATIADEERSSAPYSDQIAILKNCIKKRRNIKI